MLEKLGGGLTIIAGATGLYFLSVFRPPILLQIICAFVCVLVCLVGIVFLFAEGSILEERKKAPQIKS